METAVAVEVSAVEVRDRLLGFVEGVAARLPLRRQRENALVYVRGLIEQGGRKSLQPTLFRLEESPARYESVQQFLADSPWDPRLLIRACAERVAPQIGVVAWIVDDTGIVKDGKHSPGVKRQYSGTLGKIGNCQITVSVYGDDVRAVLEQLKSAHAGSLYFPFFFWGGNELRPMQPYLNKLPAELVDVLPQLAAAAAGSAPPPVLPEPTAPAAPKLGAAYREAEVSTLPGEREPFTVDPALVERGLKGHADTQNELARVLRAAGIEPRSRLPEEPNFDLAWEANGTVFVAEVKSITDQNEEGQLRLGLGQVLRNRHRLRGLGHAHVVAVLVPERAPRDPAWNDLCQELGIVLLSRDELDDAPTLADEL